MKRGSFGIALFFITLLHTQAQVTLRATADRDMYAIGDYITVTFTLQGTASMQFFWPEDAGMSDYDLISAKPLDTLVSGNALTLTKELIISIYDAGDAYFPSVEIPYTIPNDTTRYAVRSDSLLLRIQGIEVDTTQAIKPITDVLEVEVRNDLWWKILVAIHILFIIGFLIWFFFIRKETGPVTKAPAPVLPITDRYLNRLIALEQQKLWQQEKRKEYYSALTDILRQYLEERFGFTAMERTSDEILMQIEHHPETREQAVSIRYVLDMADMAKFAKSQPLPDENIRAMELVKQFVSVTRPAPVINEQA